MVEPIFQKLLKRCQTIHQAELFTSGLAIHLDNMTKNEQALLSEWDFWVREMTIKVENVEVFVDENLDDFTV